MGGTSVGSDIVDDLRAEWDKHGVNEKIANGADDAGGVVEAVGSKVRGVATRRSARKGSGSGSS